MRSETYLHRRRLLGLAAAGLLASCGGLSPDPDAEATARLAYRRLTEGQDAALEAMMVPSAREPDDARAFAVMRHLIPPRPPASVKRTSWRASAGTNGRVMTYEHVYDYGDRIVVVVTELTPGDDGKGWRLRAFHVTARPTGQPLQKPSGVSI